MARVVGLVAHDEKKDAMVTWVQRWQDTLQGNVLYATGTTGGRIAEAVPGLDLIRLKSGPLGGDQQLGAMIADNALDILIFFIDPLTPLPHDVDVKALMRLALVYDIPLACNPVTADCLARTVLVTEGGL